ncbi:ABC transporter substrate-binding protein [Corynebacterium lizhenjunii]|nr:ABC transporter substrate-binding protein [Corynebacterium lizhenjunii]
MLSVQPLRRGVAALCCAATVLSLSACSTAADSDAEGEGAPGGPGSMEHFGYQVATQLVSTNAGSAFGAAANAQVLATRLYPAAFVPGPEGQIIPNTDLVRAQEVEPTAQGLRQIRYEISPDATFSDGVALTCDDFVLAYTAGSMPAIFGSSMPLLASDVEDVQCASGAKDFTVVLKQDRGGRWRHMFGAGSILPSHAIARKVEMEPEELLAALRTWDPATVEPIAQVWRYGFLLEDFDPQLQVSYGPFVIEQVGASGEVVLTRNPHYHGDAAALDKLVVWPVSADSRELAASGALRVAEAPAAPPAWLDRDAADNPFDVVSTVGELSDTLTLSEDGLFAQPELRRAFAACVDQAEVAKASSAHAGVEVPATYLHTLAHNDPIARRLSGIADAHRGVDAAAAAPLQGSTVRIGYLGPNPRLAAMVEAIRSTCDPLGIQIEDASAEFMSKAYLESDPETGLPTVDAFLGAVDPMTEYSTADARIALLDELKKTENELWESVPAIPLSAQPRTFVYDRNVANVVAYTGVSGIGWNMDRWREGPAGTPVSSQAPSAQSAPARSQ